MLDDAQDLLFVALVLAKPILRRLPARFIPGLGWVLLLNDMLNLGTGFLGVALAGRSWKKAWKDSTKVIFGGRRRRLIRATEFLTRTQWLPFALQALQVSRELTGYGIQLGGLMAVVNEYTWGLFRSAGGATVQVREPPPDNFIDKCARFLGQILQLPFLNPILDPEDYDLLFAAASIATWTIARNYPPETAWARASIWANTNHPTFSPWNEASFVAIAEAGIEIEEIGTPAIVSPDPFPTLGAAAIAGHARNVQFEDTMRILYGPTAHGTIMGMAYFEAALNAWEWANKHPEPLQVVWEPEEIDLGQAIEFSVWPPRPATAEELQTWLNRAREIALATP